MKTHTIITYSIEELKEQFPEAYKKAISDNSDWNVMDDCWHECITQEAEDLGFMLVEWDLDRHTIKLGKFTETLETIAKKIVQDHGETCNTHKTASAFLKDLATLREKYPIEGENDPVYGGELELMEVEFERELALDYLALLRQEYDYQTSEEAIFDSLLANDCQFTEDGKMFRA